MSKFGIGILLSLSFFAVILSGCTTDQLANIETPTDLTKEIKIDTAKFDVSIVNIDEVRKKLASKPTIPEKRESADLKDPFILKSLKALRVSNKEKENVPSQEEQQQPQQQIQQQTPEQTQQVEQKPINIAEESPMMFNFEGLSISGNERRAILRHLTNNKAYIVKRGDIVGGYSVVDITDDSLVLVKGSEKLVITKKKK
ncbi:MAG: hypothetical protein RMJ36_00430 [Candidatus Calescibacterium sp.]|nr:hypothetical protein [Candidatus Calescibacterium sp.]MDW8132111.1 hypothetical protein [Candidatus Calescibacterium sp.]